MQLDCGLTVGSGMLYSFKPSNHTTSSGVKEVMKKVEMLKRLYVEVLNKRSEFRWSDLLKLFAPVASHSYTEIVLYELIGRGVLVKQDRKYTVNVKKLEELLKQYNVI